MTAGKALGVLNVANIITIRLNSVMDNTNVCKGLWVQFSEIDCYLTSQWSQMLKEIVCFYKGKVFP